MPRSGTNSFQQPFHNRINHLSSKHLTRRGILKLRVASCALSTSRSPSREDIYVSRKVYMSEIITNVVTNEYPKLADPEATLNPRTLNAYRHGLTGQIVLFTPEDEAAYKKHCAGVHESLRPVGYMETDLVQTIADDRWRLKRGASIEASIFACGISCPDEIAINNEQVAVSVAQGQTWVRSNKELLNVTLYCQRIQRSIEKNIELVRQYQAERKAAQDQ